jgi:desulfoferrodoxin (superoxide reductase-like protein)
MKQRLIWAIVFLFLGGAVLFANPPKKNELAFDRQQLSLKVKTIHPVSDIKNHHVKKIVVLLNDKEIASQEFEQQQNNEFQEWEFKFGPDVSLPKGTELKVISYCNIFGKKKTTITLD